MARKAARADNDTVHLRPDTHRRARVEVEFEHDLILRFRQRWAVLAAARIYGAIGRKVLTRGQLAWDSRTRVSGPEKLWHMTAAFFEAIVNRPQGPSEPILWSRHDFRPVTGW